MTASAVVKDPNRNHEPAGIRPAMMLYVAVGLVLLLGGTLAASWLTVVTVAKRDLTVETVPPTFPAPGVEPNQALERERLFKAQREKLGSYAWADREAGIAQVPIERAMELMKKGHLAGLGGTSGKGRESKPENGASNSSRDPQSAILDPRRPPVVAPKPGDGGREGR